MRLIDADALIDSIRECVEAVHDNYESDMEQGYLNAIECIEELPSAEPKKGKWIENCACSECGWCNEVEGGFVGSTRGWNFCPNCGTDMRGEINGS